MKRTIAPIVLFAVLAAILLSSCRCPKCPVTVKVAYVVPEFVCPVPADPKLTAITPEIIADDLQFKKVMGDNIILLNQSIAMWRGVYYECVQNIIKLYKAENNAHNAENEVVVPQ